MKPKHQRLWLVIIGMTMLGLGAYAMVRAFQQNIIYFYTPSELSAVQVDETQTIRLGGLVKPGSVKKGTDGKVAFVITDGEEEVMVQYKGLLPSLFSEGQGIIAEGKLAEGVLIASIVLAKHDENYMPRGVAEKVKASGHWRPK